MQLSKLYIFTACLAVGLNANAQVLPEATIGIKIPLTQKPSSRPMSVAFEPKHQHYFVADGGLAPMPGDTENQTSKSKVHEFDTQGKYIKSTQPGFDNRSIYFNPNTSKVETITYNISSAAGFGPNTGIFALDTDESGDLKESSKDVFGFNPAFGDAATMPSYNPDTKTYYAKQEHSNVILVVDLAKRESIGKIELDLASAGAQHDDITEHYVAYTGSKGEELALVDVDHKAVLIFNLSGKFIAKSALPSTLKLRAQNHLNGLGYTNDMMFVYNESEGEFGTYYGFKVIEPSK